MLDQGVYRRRRREGTIDVAFAADEGFTNPMGEVLEGFLAAMLYDTVGPALLATLGPGRFISTMELKASFLWSASPGRILGRGRVVRRDSLDDAAEREDDDRWGQYPIAGVLWTKASSVSCLTRKSATSAREM
jgi:hypothetical protein